MLATFPNRLRQLRGRQGLTQEQLADRAGIFRQAVIRLERGGVDPKLSTVQKLARALGVPLTALLE